MASLIATATLVSARPRATSRWAPCLLAALLGLVLLYGVGLTTQPPVHAAAHDMRHAAGFPCH